MIALKEGSEDAEENILAITDGQEGPPKEVIIVGAPPKETQSQTTEEPPPLTFYTGPPVHMSEVFTDKEEHLQKRQDFHKGLLSAVYGVKAYVNSLQEDLKTLKMKPQGSAAAT